MSMKENEIQVLGHESKSGWRHLWPWLVAFVVVALIVGILIGRFAIREPRIETRLDHYGECTIDSALQQTVDSLLADQLQNVNAQSGQVIVMEVATGEIRALVGLQRRFDGVFEPCQNFGHQQESGLMREVSALALLETEQVKPDSRVDTGEGLYVYHGQVVKDHNWHRGGYGVLSMDEAVCYCSNVGICRLMEETDYEKTPQMFFAQLDSMSFGKPDSLLDVPVLRPMSYTSPEDSDWEPSDLAFHSIGYERQIAPLQMLTFFNAIANDGCMVEPQLYISDTLVINPRIAMPDHIQEMQVILRNTVREGLGKKGGTDVVETAGCVGSATVRVGQNEELDYDDNEYRLEFCGYFPAQHPRYSIIVSMNKIGLPASGGGMAGPVFRQIVEYMVGKGQ